LRGFDNHSPHIKEDENHTRSSPTKHTHHIPVRENYNVTKTENRTVSAVMGVELKGGREKHFVPEGQHWCLGSLEVFVFDLLFDLFEVIPRERSQKFPRNVQRLFNSPVFVCTLRDELAFELFEEF